MTPQERVDAFVLATEGNISNAIKRDRSRQFDWGVYFALIMAPIVLKPTHSTIADYWLESYVSVFAFGVMWALSGVLWSFIDKRIKARRARAS